ncbi:caspase domain-containing protein [Mycena crocata]|nr:caspase domain-containing protein [Mycena crocata]
MARTIFALIVGIDKYRSPAIDNLRGCVQDAETMRSVLMESQTDICLLTDARATRSAILRAFNTHLLKNSRIKRNDFMVVYFAGKGHATPGPQERELNVLLPHDFSDDIPGILDTTIHMLLCKIFHKKGPNILLILDTSFGTMIQSKQRPYMLGYRSELSSMLPPPVISTTDEDIPSDYHGFYGCKYPPYVLLSACHEDELAWESTEGGEFTQALVEALKAPAPANYRALALAMARNLPQQTPFCSGLHADYPVFANLPHGPPERIPKLRVFVDSPSHALFVKEENDFIQVGHKSRRADIALRWGQDGQRIVERLDQISAYTDREILIAEEQGSDALYAVLNQIARFHYYLYLEPSTSLLGRIVHPFVGPEVGLELYELVERAGGRFPNMEVGNLVRNGVATLSRDVASKGCYGLTITNHSKRDLFPYLFYFDPADYSVELIYPLPQDTRTTPPLRGAMGKIPGSMAVGHGPAGEKMVDFGVLLDAGKRDGGFFKLIVSDRIIAVDYMLQISAFLPAGKRKAPEQGSSDQRRLPGFWETIRVVVHH